LWRSARSLGYPTDVAAGITGKRILIVHGSADRIASEVDGISHL
jgi:hypothetical protein